MSKVRIGTLVVAVVLFSAVDPVRTYGQTNPSDTTLSNLTLRSTAGTRAGQQFKGLGGLIGAVITAPLQAAVSGDELPLSPAFPARCAVLQGNGSLQCDVRQIECHHEPFRSVGEGGWSHGRRNTFGDRNVRGRDQPFAP